jgi:hypothetical protein
MAEGQTARDMQQGVSADSSSSSNSSKLMLTTFCAVLYKNCLLQLRGRFGSAWIGLLLHVALPAAFLGLMCVYKHYLPPIHHPQLQQDGFDIDTKWWAGAVPYTGEGGRVNTRHFAVGSVCAGLHAACNSAQHLERCE